MRSSPLAAARPELAETMLALLNAGLVPVVHEHGSLGASGDLAPSAHAFLPLLGEGRVTGPDGSTPRFRYHIRSGPLTSPWATSASYT